MPNAIKRLKPDPSACKYVIDKMGAKPEKTVFIDDAEANVASAEKVGMNGILFKTYKQLIKDLMRIEIKTRHESA